MKNEFFEISLFIIILLHSLDYESAKYPVIHSVSQVLKIVFKNKPSLHRIQLLLFPPLHVKQLS